MTEEGKGEIGDEASRKREHLNKTKGERDVMIICCIGE